MAEERLATGQAHTCPTVDYDCPLPGYHDRELVFPAADGNYLRPKNLLRELHRAIARYNRVHSPELALPDINLHGLRHTWNSVADDLSIPQAVRMRRLGHTSAATNDRYTHVVGEADRRAAEDVADVLFSKLTKGA
jgi:integrase